MIQPEDIKRIHKQIELAANMGNKTSDILQWILKHITSKTILVIGFIIGTIIFFIFGMVNRKNNHAR